MRRFSSRQRSRGAAAARLRGTTDGGRHRVVGSTPLGMFRSLRLRRATPPAPHASKQDRTRDGPTARERGRRALAPLRSPPRAVVDRYVTASGRATAVLDFVFFARLEHARLQRVVPDSRGCFMVASKPPNGSTFDSRRSRCLVGSALREDSFASACKPQGRRLRRARAPAKTAFRASTKELVEINKTRRRGFLHAGLVNAMRSTAAWPGCGPRSEPRVRQGHSKDGNWVAL